MANPWRYAHGKHLIRAGINVIGQRMPRVPTGTANNCDAPSNTGDRATSIRSSFQVSREVQPIENQSTPIIDGRRMPTEPTRQRLPTS